MEAASHDVFDDLNAWSWRSVNLATRDRPEHLEAGPATPGYLAMLGYGHPLALGRDFLEEEAVVGRDQVVILTHRLWRERFGADPSIVGRTVHIDAKPHVVVGVLGRGPADLNQDQLWLPLAFTPGAARPANVAEHAERDGPAEARRQRRAGERANGRRQPPHGARPISRPHITASVEPFRNDFLSEGTKRGLWLLLAAVAFVLLIACANVANLLLARGTARTRELAVRTRSGASRGQLVRQLMTESLMLAIVGGALGILLAAGLLRAVVALMPSYLLPTEADVRLNVAVLLFSLFACAVSGVLAGSAPAWQALRTNVNESLKLAAPAAGGGGARLRQALVTLEFALALTLLTAGGLALQGLYSLTRVDLGFRADHVLTFMLPVPEDRPTTPEKARQFYGELLRRVRALPGVSSAAVSTSMPLQRGGMGIPFMVAGRPPSDPFRPRFASLNMVTPEYFSTLGIRTVRGRAFSDRDTAGAVRVAMINESAVKRYLPDVDPLAQRLVIPELTPGVSSPGQAAEWQIVGVFADVRHSSAAEAPPPHVAVPFDQSPWAAARVAVRTSGEPGNVRRAIDGIIQSLDPDLPMADVKTMEQRVSRIARRRAIQHRAVRRFRGGGAAAGGVRDLRRDVVLRRPAHARDRRADGARGRAGVDREGCPAGRPDDRGRWRRARVGGRVVGGPSAAGSHLRRRRAPSRPVPGDHGYAAVYGPARLPGARAAGGVRPADGRAARRVAARPLPTRPRLLVPEHRHRVSSRRPRRRYDAGGERDGDESDGCQGEGQRVAGGDTEKLRFDDPAEGAWIRRRVAARCPKSSPFRDGSRSAGHLLSRTVVEGR